MTILRAQVIHEHSSGLPKDNAVNTFHFDAPAGSLLQPIADALNDFYGLAHGVTGGASRSVGGYLSGLYVARRIKIYAAAGDPPHAPLLDQRTTSLPTRESNANLPSEVACCGSFEGTPTSGLIQTRRRGRVYIGALNAAASNAQAGIAARPLPIFREAIVNALTTLQTALPADYDFGVYSRPYAGRAAVVRPGRTTLPAIPARSGTFVRADRFWCDDAFDTVRRRGDKATGRGTIATA